MLTLGSVTGTGWQAENVSIHLSLLSTRKVALRLKLDALTLAVLKEPLRDLSLHCQQMQYTVEQVACTHAQLHVGDTFLDKPDITLSFKYNLSQQSIELDIQTIVLATGQIKVKASSEPTGWQASLHIRHLNLGILRNRLNHLIEVPQVFTLAGLTTLTLKLTGRTQLDKAQVEGRIIGFSFANASGTQAGENLTALIKLQLTAPKAENLHIQGMLTVEQGEIYSDPLYVQIIKDPVVLTVNATWQSQHLSIHHFHYMHINTGILQGFAEIALGKTWALEQLTLQLHPSSIEQIYTHYLQAWLGYALSFTGTIAIRFEKNIKNSLLEINLNRINIFHDEKHINLTDLEGALHWRSDRNILPTKLSWAQIQMGDLSLGPSQLKMLLNDREIRLLDTWHQPLLDGFLTIEQFQLNHLGQKALQWQLSGKLQAISLATLSTTLGWPLLKGQIDSTIPLISYDNNRLNVASGWRLPLFDGQITLGQFHLAQPFNDTPVLNIENIDIERLNLQTITHITQFGEIQGQLSGRIQQLQLVNWQVVGFDAYFMTPLESTLPRKISQKAIDNISSLGGGGTVDALSRRVLSLFEHFPYERIGWGCHLQHGICAMRGLESASDRYYIVKGGGLPRIDVIGYSQRVDWQVLLDRLKRVTESRKPVIQ